MWNFCCLHIGTCELFLRVRTQWSSESAPNVRSTAVAFLYVSSDRNVKLTLKRRVLHGSSQLVFFLYLKSRSQRGHFILACFSGISRLVDRSNIATSAATDKNFVSWSFSLCWISEYHSCLISLVSLQYIQILSEVERCRFLYLWKPHQFRVFEVSPFFELLYRELFM